MIEFHLFKVVGIQDQFLETSNVLFCFKNLSSFLTFFSGHVKYRSAINQIYGMTHH